MAEVSISGAQCVVVGPGDRLVVVVPDDTHVDVEALTEQMALLKIEGVVIVERDAWLAVVKGDAGAPVI